MLEDKTIYNSDARKRGWSLYYELINIIDNKLEAKNCLYRRTDSRVFQDDKMNPKLNAAEALFFNCMITFERLI
jgi:hypothetical protein